MFESTWNLWTVNKLQTQTSRLTEPADQQEKQARNLAWVQIMIQNQCRLKKVSANQQLSESRLENRAQDPDHWSGLRHFNQEPKQAKCFRMQTVDKPSKKTQMAFKKH